MAINQSCLVILAEGVDVVLEEDACLDDRLLPLFPKDDEDDLLGDLVEDDLEGDLWPLLELRLPPLLLLFNFRSLGEYVGVLEVRRLVV